MEKLYRALRKRRQNESGFTLSEEMVVIAILCVIAAMVIPALVNGTRSSEKMSKWDNTTAEDAVAVELRSIRLNAEICYNLGSPYPMGDVYTEVDAMPCLRERLPHISETLRFIVRKKQFEVLCVAGYDTTREIDSYNPADPYVFFFHSRSYRGQYSSCGTYDKNNNFIWTSAASVDNRAAVK